MTIKLFAVERVGDSKIHISTGMKPVTLCGRKDIYSAIQMQKIDSKVSQVPEPDCSRCTEEFRDIKEDKKFEPTVQCYICDTPYSAKLSRFVNIDSKSTVCRPCYKELLQDESTDITIPYEEAEPVYD